MPELSGAAANSKAQHKLASELGWDEESLAWGSNTTEAEACMTM
jgi:hypothetical protein